MQKFTLMQLDPKLVRRDFSLKVCSELGLKNDVVCIDGRHLSMFWVISDVLSMFVLTSGINSAKVF